MTEPFDDPQLKQAVRRVWGEEQASPMLRQRITQLLAQEEAAPARMSLVSRISNWGWAIAAVVILGIGLSGWQFFPRPAVQGGEALPNYIAEAMIKTHDGCCRSRNHYRLPGVGHNDFPAIGNTLAAALKIPVISIPIDHWQFAGGACCGVHGHPTGHLIYRNGHETLSIFSVPASDFQMSEGENYVANVGTHHIAGFVQSGGLYCVVVNDPDGTMTDTQARELRDHLHATFASCAVAASNALPSIDLALLTDSD
jgi:hypothetical protein